MSILLLTNDINWCCVDSIHANGTKTEHFKNRDFLCGLKALAHYKDFHNDFPKKNRCENRCPYIKLLKKSLQL